MPFFSFILEKNYTPISLGIIHSNIKILKNKTRYYCKRKSKYCMLNFDSFSKNFKMNKYFSDVHITVLILKGYTHFKL